MWPVPKVNQLQVNRGAREVHPDVLFELRPFHFFCLFRAAPVAYGGSQTRGQIRAVAAGLYHSHSNTGSKPHL